MDPTTLVFQLIQHHTTISVLFAQVINLIALHTLFDFLYELLGRSYERPLLLLSCQMIRQ